MEKNGLRVLLKKNEIKAKGNELVNQNYQSDVEPEYCYNIFFAFCTKCF
jgi:hypothetical protein